MSRPLLILRPEPGASATARAAEALGLTTTIRPLFAIRPLDWTPPDPDKFDALMLTSANAARAAGESLARYAALPLFAVGERTAEAARAAGAADVRVGPGDAAGLIATIADSGVRRLLHLCGADRRAIDPGALTIAAIPVYRSEPIDPPPSLADAEAHVVLLHSPRAAALFARLAPARATTRIAAISPAAREAAGEGWAASAVAARPDDAALLAAAAGLCQ